MSENRVLPYEVYYINSKGDRLYFDRMPYILTDSSLFNTNWRLNTVRYPLYDGCRLISKRRGLDEFSLELRVSASHRTELARLLTRLSDLLEYDVVNGVCGRLYINGQYLRCWCSASEKKLSCDFDSAATVRLSVLPELPVWVTEKHFSISGASSTDDSGHMYPYNYPKRYGSGKQTVFIENSHFAPAPMKITFYGAAVSPGLTDGSRNIGIDITLGVGEYAVVDQMTREVYSVSDTGVRTNCFDRRSRTGGIFEYLPFGRSALTLESSGTADIILYELRSEPVWALN